MESVLATWVPSTVPQNHQFPLRNTHIPHCDVRATPVVSTTSWGSAMLHLTFHNGDCACHLGGKHSSSQPPVSLEKYAHPTLRCKSDKGHVHNKLGECNGAPAISSWKMSLSLGWQAQFLITTHFPWEMRTSHIAM
jgi:hypothetical protein